MSRLGESDLSCGASRVGTIWVEALYAEPAFAPRLGLRIGCQLRELPANEYPPRPALRDYRLVDLRFQLRWQSDTGPILGSPVRSGGSNDLRSAEYAPDYQLSIALELSREVIERIENERSGSRPRFTLEAWAGIVLDGELEQGYVTPIRFDVPQDMWTEFLRRSGVAEIDILEVRRVGRSADQMGAAADHLRAAQAALIDGAAERAVGICRKALEAAAGPGPGDPWLLLDQLFSSAAGPRVGTQYSKILKALKQITGEDHHHYGSTTRFARSEAQFVLRCVGDMVTLIGCLHEQRGDGGEAVGTATPGGIDP